MIRLLILFLLIASIVLGVVFFWPKSEKATTLDSNFVKYEKISELYTYFGYVPIIDKKYKDEDPIAGGTQPIGYCYKKYEVGFGYLKPFEAIEKYRENACANQWEKLPEPIVLSINAVESEVKGVYKLQDCEMWDKIDSKTNQKRSERMVLYELKKQFKSWDSIATNSQQLLSGFLKVYCDELQ